MVQQNMRVFKFAVIPFMAALVLLAGCSTSTEESMPPDWSGANDPHRLTNSPPLAVTTNVLKTNLPPIVHSNQPPVRPAPLQTWTSLDRWAKENKIPLPQAFERFALEHLVAHDARRYLGAGYRQP